MKFTVGTKIGAGFAVALAALVAIGMTSYLSINKLTETADWVARTHKILERLEDVFSLVKDAQLGSRGFVIVGDESYLDPYNSALASIDGEVTQLRQAMVDKDQLRRLEAFQPKIREELDVLRKVIQIRKNEGLEAAAKEVLKGEGKKAMEEIRAAITEMQSAENDLLKKRSDAAQSTADTTRLEIIWGTVLASGLLLLVGIVITRNVADPLKEISRIAEKVATGDLNVNVSSNGRSDEVGVLAHTFNRMTESLQTMAKAAEEVAAGNLAVSIKPQSSKDVVGNALATMVQKLASLIGQVQKSGIQVTTSGTQIAATARQQQATASEISSTTTEISATAKEISATSKELVKSMKEVAGVAEETATLAVNGQTGLKRMDTTMRQIMEASGSISARLAVLSEKAGTINTVVTTIAKVADQTNLLSLNAAIEAEKAGEYGRGFAVVATEIRRLADQTAAATSDIEQMVKEMQSAVSAGVMGMDKFSEEVRRGGEVVREVSAQLNQIIEQVQTLTPNFETVNEGMQSQSVGAQQISEALTQLGEAAQQTVESLRQSNMAIEQLNEVTAGLQSGVSRFKLGA